MEGLRLEAEAEYRHSTWKANKDAEPKRPLMHTNVCVHKGKLSASPMALEDWAPYPFLVSFQVDWETKW